MDDRIDNERSSAHTYGSKKKKKKKKKKNAT